MNKKETIAQVMELTTEMAKGRKGSFVILTKITFLLNMKCFIQIFLRKKF
jgi:hypothetical protein